MYKLNDNSSHRSLTDDRFNKNVTKKCGWVIVGFLSYFTNLLRSKSDLLGPSSYIDFSISHVNFHLRNLAVFEFFAFIGRTYVHWLEKNIQNMVFDVKFHAESDPNVRKIL